MENQFVTVRRANVNDHKEVTKYAIKIVRQHQNYNPLRFMEFENHEEQLADFFAEQFLNPKAIVLVVEIQGKIVGYSFTRLEESSFVDISAAAAWLHDIYVDETARGFGAGKLLLNASIDAAKQLGSQTLMLQVAVQNEFAKKLFETNGFNVSTYEMMKTLNEG